MGKVKVSICITVLNEERSINHLLKSLLAQTKLPNEIVIVDGGSIDKTVDIVKFYQKNHRFIKLFISPGSIAHGRNISIAKAQGDIIALTDAGCRAKRDWLKKITLPFSDYTVGLVAGFYIMPSKNASEKALNIFQGIVPKDFNSKNFIPSARSVAFRKSVWERVGGFDEEFKKAGEDTKFFYDVSSQASTKIVRIKDAIVEWRESGNYIDRFRKFFNYAKGDAESGIWWNPVKRFKTHNIKVLTIFGRYLIAAFILILTDFSPFILGILSGLYALFAFTKTYSKTADFKASLWAIVIQVISDWAVMAGFAAGTIVRYGRV